MEEAKRLISTGEMEHRGDDVSDNDLLAFLEPNQNFSSLHGNPLSFCFIARKLIAGFRDACATDIAQRYHDLSFEMLSEEVLPTSTRIAPITSKLPEIRSLLLELAWMTEYTKTTDWTWQPAVYGQHFDDDEAAYLSEASLRFQNEPAMLKAVECFYHYLEAESASYGKYWEVEVDDKDLKYRSGKLGQIKSWSTKTYDSHNDALKDAEKRLSAKRKKGYF